MARRFAVGINGTSTEHERELREFFHSHGSWWHWVPNFWLVLSIDDQITCAEIRNKVRDVTGGSHCIVVEVNDARAWASYGPAGEKKFSRWLRETWMKDYSKT